MKATKTNTRTTLYTLALLAAVLLTALLACTNPTSPTEALTPKATLEKPAAVSPANAAGAGTLELFLKDFPLQDKVVSNLWVTILSVQVHGEAAGWETVFESPQGEEIDLLELVEEPAHLSTTELPADLYTQVRLVLGDDNRIVIADEREFPLRVPSGQQTGIKIVGEFEVRPGQSTSLLLDFDAQESVKVAGRNKGRYLLRPTIRIEEVSYTPVKEPKSGYERLVIETYPAAPNAPATDTTLLLYDASGLLASADDPADPAVIPAHQPSALIDYVPATPLASGAVLFVSIYSSTSNPGPYSIRVAALPVSAVLPGDSPAYTYSEIGGINADDSPYEGYEATLGAEPWKDTYEAGDGPARLELGEGTPLHRYLGGGHDVDWVMITLP